MSDLKTIAVGGFQHETNTFAPHFATYAGFEKADSWPGLTTGEALFAVMQGLNIPLAGFIQSALQKNHKLLPLCWCAAEPSSFVTTEAFENISSIICDGLRGFDSLDAVYLDLHGAMVTMDYEDGEGELIRRVRAVIGDAIPLVISLDLHANVTEAMLAGTDVMTIYRTYPHLDMAETGMRACEQLQRLFDGVMMQKKMLKLPYLIPLTSQCTDFEPCRSLYQKLVLLDRQAGISNVDFAAGFPPSDIRECGPAIVVYGDNIESVEACATQYYQELIDREAEFRFELLEADDAVQHAMLNTSDQPVVLADAQDNPGAGGTSDTTGLLDALVRNGAREAVLAVLYDPEVSEKAHQLGIGAVFEAKLGGKSGFTGSAPYKASFAVEALGDGRFTFTGEMNLNSQAQLGKMALLRIIDENSEVRVVVGSIRSQCLDLAMIRHLGIEPTRQRIVAVKSTVHFRADFDPIAARTLVVIAPGANVCRLEQLDYQNLRHGVRLEPLGRIHGTATN